MFRSITRARAPIQRFELREGGGGAVKALRNAVLIRTIRVNKGLPKNFIYRFTVFGGILKTV